MERKMTTSLLFLVILAISSTFGSKISFCEDQSDQDVYLDLSNVGINALRKSFVTGASIKCLNLADNQISSIDQQAFASLSGLKSLNLSGNPMEFGNFYHLHSFAELKTLIIDAALLNTNQFPEREDPNGYTEDPYRYGDYDPYGRRVTTTMKPKLKSKFLLNSFTMFANVGIFPHLENLSICNYENPQVITWLANFDVPNLRHLYLTGNKLTSDSELTERITRNLTHLYLDDNEVSTFSGIKLSKLRHLSLNKNKIRRLCSVYCNENSMTPRTMQSLENLSIEANEIVAVDADAFINSINLVSLNLAKNSMETFARHTFDNMTNLENLTLDDNRFEQVPDICALVNLRSLSMNENRITSIDGTTFCNLQKLTFVSLRKNHLTMVESGTFAHLPGLIKLDMSWNDISSLPENWMRSGISLEELNLDANGFNDIASMSLGQFESLGYLSIGQNPLKTITVESLINLPVKTTLDLARVCQSKDDSNPPRRVGLTTISPRSHPYYGY